MNVFNKMFTSKVVSRPNTDDEEKIRQLHLSATQNIRNGHLDEAISELSEAQKLMPIVSTEYPITQYLRLPTTLQKAGRFQDSLDEFNRLLKINSRPYHKSNVYDKLRLACQREGRHSDAIYYGILAIAWECIALDEQHRDYSDFATEPERWIKPIRKSLKILKKESVSDAICKRCLIYAREPSDSSANMLVLEVRNLIQT